MAMKFDILVLEPMKEMMMRVVHFIPTFIVALLILIIGYVLTKMITKLLVSFFRSIGLDHVCIKSGFSKVLKKGGIKEKPSTLLGCLAYWTMMVIVLFATFKALGLTMVTVLLDKILGYIPSIISGVFVLIIGMLLAKFVSILVYVAAKNTDMPIPDVLSRLSKWAIVVYVSILYLKEVGLVSLFGGVHYSIFIAGIVFAFALSFGLAGKDIASKYLDVFKRHEEG